jgi:hypothetical protein
LEIPITIRAIDEFTSGFNSVVNVFQRFESIAMRVDVSQLRLQNSQERVAQAADRLAEAQSRVSDAYDQVNTAAQSLAGAEQSLASARETAAITAASRLADIEERLSGLRQDATGAALSVKESELGVERSRTNLVEANARVVELETQLAALRSKGQGGTAKAKDLEEQLATAKFRVREAGLQVERSEYNLGEARDRVTDISQDLVDTEEDLEEAKAITVEQDENVVDATDAVEKARKELTNATKDAEKADKGATTANSQLEIAQRSLEVTTIRANKAQQDSNLLMIQAGVNVIPQMLGSLTMASATMGPFGLAVGALGIAVGIGVTAITQNWGGVGTAFNNVWNNDVSPRLGDISTGIDKFKDEHLTPLIDKINNDWGPAFAGLGAPGGPIDKVLGILGNLATALSTTLVNAIDGLLSGMKKFLDSPIGQAFKWFFETLLDTISQIASTLASLDISKIASRNVITPTPGGILAPATLPGAMTSGAGDLAVKNAALLAGTVAGSMVGAGLASTYGGISGIAGVLEGYSLTGGASAATGVGAGTLIGGILGGGIAGGYVGGRAVAGYVTETPPTPRPTVHIEKLEINSLSEIDDDTARIVAEKIASEVGKRGGPI